LEIASSAAEPRICCRPPTFHVPADRNRAAPPILDARLRRDSTCVAVGSPTATTSSHTVGRCWQSCGVPARQTAGAGPALSGGLGQLRTAGRATRKKAPPLLSFGRLGRLILFLRSEGPTERSCAARISGGFGIDPRTSRIGIGKSRPSRKTPQQIRDLATIASRRATVRAVRTLVTPPLLAKRGRGYLAIPRLRMRGQCRSATLLEFDRRTR